MAMTEPLTSSDIGVSPESPPGRRRTAAFGFIFATAVMNALSFGLMIPVLPNLIKHFTGGDTAQASEWNVLFATVWGAMQFFVSPVLGLLSDRVGRRPVMLISIFGLGVDFLFMAFAPTLGWLFVGRVLNGLTSASVSTANAYVADITPPEDRARNFGMMGSAFSFGFLIGPVVGGFLAGINLRLPFIVAAGLALTNAVYGLLVLPESLPPERRARAFDWRRANPIGSLRFLGSHRDLLSLGAIGFLFQLAFSVMPAIFVLYTGYRYHWTPFLMGLTMMVSGAAGVFVQVVLVGPVVRRLGERGAVILGAASGALAYAIYGFAPTGWLYMAGVPVFAMASFLQPGLLGLMSRRVGPSEQGQMQGATQSLQGMASILGPIIYGLTFAWSVRHDATLHAPGLAILIASGLMTANVLLAIAAAKRPAAVPTG
jgi:DHA1 family tetracycline resistance protein-like MFS transporter